ncbi:VTT domain-containing protein [Sphingobacterium sp. ML3W]|jgi:membrane-associated protein|uniref:DedA family protein n=1 Tax=Sphingobacterium TaxID=28453 RepID=UPI0015532839|nr:MULTISPECIES: VTT domain-containing protein [Sphingobacterium]MDF2478817.1 DedA family protein [Sphingobacterium sp.]NPE46896.1 DedA family protein [Sphingobacterium prati]WFA80648.1 VTT domain-containing protein [Sphingobacterium sp. ML3W]
MDVFFEFLNNLTNPDWIVSHGGLYLLLFIIFAETGILIGFFLPGDPILFIAGMIVSNMSISPSEQVPTLLYWIVLVSLAAILGNFVGYWCGKIFGKRIMSMEDSWFFKKSYIFKAQEFYEKRGGGAIVLARFLPIVRTFAPIVAGIVGMEFRKFVLYNVIGAVVWSGSLVTLGYLLGENVWVKENLELVIIVIVLIATAPVIIKAFTSKDKAKIAQ